MHKPDMAVVVPAYNEQYSIRQTLDGLYSQTNNSGVLHVVVNNNSTDNTRAVCEQFGVEHPDFPLHIIDETQKGTGAAIDTGFLHAIKHGAQILGRTDADTVPTSNWVAAIHHSFSRNPTLQLLGGKRSPRTDDGWYRRRDALFWPAGLATSRLIAKAGGSFGTIGGNNMATRAMAYIETGGFPRTAIDTVDEDHVYEDVIRERYGHHAVHIDPAMLVHTSMRRVRQLGYLRLARWRADPESAFRQSHVGHVDIRVSANSTPEAALA